MSRIFDRKVAFIKRLWSGVAGIAANSQLHPLPIIEARHYYNTGMLSGDLRAALNVALLAFPQGCQLNMVSTDR